MGSERYLKGYQMHSTLKDAPQHVAEAYRTNPDLHRAMSKAGGKRSVQSRENNTLYKEWAGNVTMSNKERQEQAGEDILPPDNIN